MVRGSDSSSNLRVEVITDHFDVVGFVQVGSQRLSDFLNRQLRSHLVVREATVVTLAPVRKSEEVELLHLNSDHILVVIPRGPEASLEDRRKASDFTVFEMSTYPVRMRVGNLEIEGQVPLLPSQKYAAALRRRTRRYVPILSTTARLLTEPHWQWTHPVMIINWARTELLASRPTPQSPPTV